MKSGLPKVLHAAGGLPLIEHVLRTADTLSPTSIVIVVGHQAEAVRGSAGGTAESSVRAAGAPARHGSCSASGRSRRLPGATGTVVLLSGDVPLLTPATLQALVNRHVETGAAATVLTAMVDDPAGYGRIERRDGGISAIVEHKDASPEQRQIREINSGIYAFDLAAAVRCAEADRFGQRAGRVLPAGPGEDLPRPRSHGGDRHARRSAGDFRRQQPQGTGADWAALEDDQERRPDGIRRHHRRSGDRVHRSRRHDRARHHHSPERLSRRAHHDRLGLRDSMRRPHRQFDARGQRLRQQLLRDHRFARRQRREARPVRAHPAGLACRRGRARRQLRRAEEDDARPRRRRPTTSPISATR